MIKTVRRRGHDPHLYFSKASVLVRDAIGDGLADSMEIARFTAATDAPIYNKARWYFYRKYKHHIQSGKGGRLKASIKAIKVRNIGRNWRSGLYSKLKYSSYQEKGFRHRFVGKKSGKFFMRDAIAYMKPYVLPSFIKSRISKMFKRLG